MKLFEENKKRLEREEAERAEQEKICKEFRELAVSFCPEGFRAVEGIGFNVYFMLEENQYCRTYVNEYVSTLVTSKESLKKIIEERCEALKNNLRGL